MSEQTKINNLDNSEDVFSQRISMNLHAFLEYLQTKRMEAVENIICTISHDLRNYILVLKGNLSLLKAKDPSNNLIIAMQKITEQIERLTNKLASLGISDNLSETKELEIGLQIKDLSSEVKEVLSSLKTSLDSNIKIHFIPSNYPLPVKLASGDCWSILSNLISNACEAMNGKGEIIICTEFRKITEEYCELHGNAFPGNFAVLSCSDQGCGIPEDMLEKIFEPMVSTKQGSSKVFRGWGLAIVYTLVKKRGGWIHVSSKVGEGTTFEIFLPLVS